MKVQLFRSVGLVALSYSMVALTASNAQLSCIDTYIGDGDCDGINNNAGCGYDGGDCCEESCVSTTYLCGSTGSFDCLDPEHSGDSEDPDGPETSFSFSFSFSFGCQEDKITNFFCNPSNNNEACGFDGGDCCSCTCPPDFFGAPCGGQFGNTCVDPSAPCVDGFVEAGTLTAVTVSANGYDMRAGDEFGSNGCMEDGCQPGLTRDGDVENAESRWSCSQGLVPEEDLCAITFSFEEPQDIAILQVAFYKTDVRSRSLQVTSNGEDAGTFDSSPDTQSGFTAFTLGDVGVETLTLTTSGLDEDEFISILEVNFMVKDPDM